MAKKSYIKGHVQADPTKYFGKSFLKSYKYVINEKTLNYTFSVVKQTPESVKGLKVSPDVLLVLSMFNDKFHCHFETVDQIEEFIEDMYSNFSSIKSSLEKAHLEAKADFRRIVREQLDADEQRFSPKSEAKVVEMKKVV